MQGGAALSASGWGGAAAMVNTTAQQVVDSVGKSTQEHYQAAQRVLQQLPASASAWRPTVPLPSRASPRRRIRYIRLAAMTRFCSCARMLCIYTVYYSGYPTGMGLLDGCQGPMRRARYPALPTPPSRAHAVVSHRPDAPGNLAGTLHRSIR